MKKESTSKAAVLVVYWRGQRVSSLSILFALLLLGIGIAMCPLVFLAEGAQKCLRTATSLPLQVLQQHSDQKHRSVSKTENSVAVVKSKLRDRVASSEATTPTSMIASQQKARTREKGTSTLADATRISQASDQELPPMDFGDGTEPGPSGMKLQNSLQGLRGPIYYSEKFKFAYLHQYKNGGSAIIDNLNALLCAMEGKKVGEGCEMKRGQCINSFKTCPDRTDLYTFTFSRNPWDRAVSMWSYGLKRKQKKLATEAERKAAAANYCSFDEMLELAHAYLVTKTLKDYGTQEQICGGHWGDTQWRKSWTERGSPLNFIGRLEHFERDWRAVLLRIDPSGRLLSQYKKSGFMMANDSGHKKYTEYYTDELRDMVATIYQADVANLGYGFEDAADKKAVNVTRYRDGKPAASLGFGVLG